MDEFNGNQSQDQNASVPQEPTVSEPVQNTDYSYSGDYQAPVQEKKGLSIASLVLGIISIVIACAWYFGIPCAIASIITGSISIVKKKGAKGMAIGGIICSAIGILISIILIVAVFGAMSAAGGYDALMNQFGM